MHNLILNLIDHSTDAIVQEYLNLPLQNLFIPDTKKPIRVTEKCDSY